MAISGIGEDGYFRIQKESTYGTDVTNSMTDLPVLPGTLITAAPQMIENNNLIASRLKQDPNAGRNVVGGKIMMDAHPTLIGLMMNLFLGTSTNGTVTDSTYLHTWLSPITSTRVGKSFTAQQAMGADTADQFSGGVITKMVMKGDNQGKVSFEFDVVATDYTESVSRVSSWSYPTATPINFSMGALTITPSGVSAITQLFNSFSFEVDLGYQTDRFKFGSRGIQNPIFNTIPKTTFKVSIDAEQQYTGYARSLKEHAIALTFTHTEYAAGTTVFLTAIEIPVARLKTETAVPSAAGLLTQELEFDCSYGGTTTGSGSDLVQFEFRHKDATAAYA